MSTVVTVPVTVTASESVVVVTSTIAASDVPGYTSTPTASASAGSSDASISSTSANGSAASGISPPSSSSRNGSTPIGAIVGGAVGGIVLLAFLIVLACLYRKRSNAKKKAQNPFPDPTEENGPAVIAGLPPNPSGSRTRPTSGNYNSSLSMTEAGSSMPLLSTDTSLYTASQLNAASTSDARSAHVHRPSTVSLAPSFLMGSAASFPHSHGSQYGQPTNVAPVNSYDSSAAFAGAYPDVHRTAYYEPYAHTGIDPRAMPASKTAAGSAAAAYHNGSAASTLPGSPVHVDAGNAGMPSLPIGAAPSDYATASESARFRSMSQGGHVGEPTCSGAASLNDARSRRNSHASALVMPPPPASASAHSQDDVEGLQERRPPAAGLAGYQSNLNTIPASVAASEVASGDHHSMQSGAFSNRGDLSVPPRLPSIPASSPLMTQGAPAFAPATSFSADADPRLTAEPGTDTLRSSDPSNGGTFNSDGTYNTYTGAVKGPLRVIGSTDVHSQGPPTIAEEGEHIMQAQRGMSGDSKTTDFWVDAPEKAQLGAAGKRLGQHSANNSSSSINKSGSRLFEMLDSEQLQVPDSVTGGDDIVKRSASPTRPPFWKERSRSAQSITKVFRSSPLLNANHGPSSSTDRSPARTATSSRISGNAGAAETEHLPSLDLGRSSTNWSHAKAESESPKTEAEADMWRQSSTKSKPTSALRKWTTKRTSKTNSKQESGDNQIDVDQLFR